MMPIQLRLARRPKRSEPRAIAEQTTSISIYELKVPRSYDTMTMPWIGLRYPGLCHARLSAQQVEFTHNNTGRTQSFTVQWQRVGYGFRPVFVCSTCSRSVKRLYLHHGNISCRQCSDIVYACQVCDSKARTTLQAHRLKAFLRLKTGMWRSNRQRLQARYRSLQAKLQPTHNVNARLSDRALLPVLNYATRGAMHWH